jgi:hypothetical protein
MEWAKKINYYGRKSCNENHRRFFAQGTKLALDSPGSQI